LSSAVNDKQREYQISRANMRFLNHLPDDFTFSVSSWTLKHF
jgi:hypothetical protein